jgi:hypothetical protein
MVVLVIWRFFEVLAYKLCTFRLFHPLMDELARLLGKITASRHTASEFLFRVNFIWLLEFE